jgi:flagellar basal-body rod protein FlgF
VDKLLYVAMSGASENAIAQKAHANNLANVSTNGFQRDLEQARSMPVFGEVNPSRAYAMSERPGTDFSQGSMVDTGRELDVAVKGDGWMAVQTADGGEAYTRTSSMNIDALGVLRDGKGLPVMGNSGPIAVPPQQQIEIGADGTISVRSLGESPQVMAQIDRIKLVKGDQSTMVESGFLQSSNVNAVDEMTSVLALSRQFELHIKMMKTAEQDDESMARVLQMG